MQMIEKTVGPFPSEKGNNEQKIQKTNQNVKPPENILTR